MLAEIQTFILDTLFPINCISCGRDDVWLCDDCLHDMELLSIQVCPKCEDAITESGQTCRNCKSDSSLDALLVATGYKDKTISKLVHLYKYKFIESLHIPLGKILIKNLLRSQLAIPDIIIPVPLHPRRLRWRGFNQSQLLVGYISQNLTPGFEVAVDETILRRQRYTPPQMKIKKYSERLSNLQDAFVVARSIADGPPVGGPSASPQNLHGKTILLIDDIATTGATLFECAKVLKQNGAKKVFAAVIARQEME